MNNILIKVVPANSKLYEYDFNFIPVEIFEKAIEHCNNSSAFKRNHKKLELLKITKNFIVLKFYFNDIEMPSKSFSGFSRFIINSGYKHYFKDFEYNSSLFKYIICEDNEEIIKENKIIELSNLELSKEILNILFGQTDFNKVNEEKKKKFIEKLKIDVINYINDIKNI